ncbi:putative membrane protein [Natronocella acetinitrilica]|uniref:Membrane protein n=1 Tax=Natronocella acetinitrilica TaxID=414046 RepID=A0AAE3G5J1_9GAMM|nr:LapA family protein [Natronocella acetinitrilica]MCP1674803.1 putative membrane protein [Natronocella acetinitrilica]
MRRILLLIAILVVILFGLSFALLNATPTEMDFYFGAVTLPLSLLLVITLIVGALLGLFAASAVMVGRRRELGRTRRQLTDAEKELQELRRLPLKDQP